MTASVSPSAPLPPPLCAAVAVVIVESAVAGCCVAAERRGFGRRVHLETSRACIHTSHNLYDSLRRMSHSQLGLPSATIALGGLKGDGHERAPEAHGELSGG